MSEITSEGPPKQPAEAGNIAITGVLGTRRLEYTFPDGEPAGEPTDIISPATFTTTLRSLQHISEQLAPGEHTDQELARASRATTKAIGYLVIRMEESAPAGIGRRAAGRPSARSAQAVANAPASTAHAAWAASPSSSPTPGS